MISKAARSALPPPPMPLIDTASLFLDFDGTLVEIADRPDEIHVDGSLHDLLASLRAGLDGRVAIVSGRSLAQLDKWVGTIAQELAISGSHGIEHRWNGVTARPERPAALDPAERSLRDFASAHPGTLVESKSFSVALHYRLAPGVEQSARSLAERLSRELDLTRELGKMVVELRVSGANKGLAVRRLMAQPPMAGTLPLFFGDDLTDESAFEAAASFGGAGILVGEPRETAAIYGLPDVTAVREWLSRVAQ